MRRFLRNRWTRRVVVALAAVVVLLIVLLAGGMMVMLRMPGKSFAGALPPLTRDQAALRDDLRRDVQKLAGDIGERNVAHYPKLAAAADWIDASFRERGYKVKRLSYTIAKLACDNIEVEIPGGARGSEIVVVGAHYDSVRGGPGANDNGSGVAAVLALAARASKEFAAKKPERTLRFVAFVNEEVPFFPGEQMGSMDYAHRCRKNNDNIVAMLSLETIGYYRDEPGSQSYPPIVGAAYPKSGNFIAFVGNIRSRHLVRDVVGSFRRHAEFPSEGVALPAIAPGAAWSDHASFWHVGYPGLMVTDTAPFRYPWYHTAEDTPDKIDYDRMARVVDGLWGVTVDLVGR